MTKEEIIQKYLGKHFGHGKSGCFMFVKAFYKEEYGINLRNDYLQMLGDFQVVEIPRIGDIVILHTHPIVTDHCGIWIGDDEFIHGGHLQTKSEVMIHRLNDYPYAGKLNGFLRHPQVKE